MTMGAIFLNDWEEPYGIGLELVLSVWKYSFRIHKYRCKGMCVFMHIFFSSGLGSAVSQ